MTFPRQSHPCLVSHLQVAGVCLMLLVSAGYDQSEACTLRPDHAGLTFPVERVDPVWTCRLQAIIQNHTTESTLGPMRTALSESLYRYLLDAPPFAAALIRRLRLGLYQSDARGPGRFWGDDGEGTKGMVELVYEDPVNRIYFLEGTHESRILPHVTGKAVVFLRMDVVREPGSLEAMDSTLVAYIKLDNRVLSGLVSLLHPLVTKVVTSRLQKGVATVDRLGLVMTRDPQRVWSEVEKPPPLLDHHVAFLKQSLNSQLSPDNVSPHGRSMP